MFAGTYTSEFYRAIRNLLHEQVTQPGSPVVNAKWEAHIAREAQFRNVDAVSPDGMPGFEPSAAFS